MLAYHLLCQWNIKGNKILKRVQGFPAKKIQYLTQLSKIAYKNYCKKGMPYPLEHFLPVAKILLKLSMNSST